jgi:two-component system CheB/CheR fusion protein
MVALQQLAARAERIFHVDCRFRCDAPVLIHGSATGIHLYRIAQEAISNAIKHGRAGSIDIGLTLNNEDIILAIRDNGIGIPVKRRKGKGMGLRVMQYRAGVIGGSLAVQRQPHGGNRRFRRSSAEFTITRIKMKANRNRPRALRKSEF